MSCGLLLEAAMVTQDGVVTKDLSGGCCNLENECFFVALQSQLVLEDTRHRQGFLVTSDQSWPLTPTIGFQRNPHFWSTVSGGKL